MSCYRKTWKFWTYFFNCCRVPLKNIISDNARQPLSKPERGSIAMNLGIQPNTSFRSFLCCLQKGFPLICSVLIKCKNFRAITFFLRISFPSTTYTQRHHMERSCNWFSSISRFPCTFPSCHSMTPNGNKQLSISWILSLCDFCLFLCELLLLTSGGMKKCSSPARD